MHRNVLIRIAHGLDNERVFEFIDSNPSRFIRTRAENEFVAAIDANSLFLAETLDGFDADRMVIGVSAVFQPQEATHEFIDDHNYYELGSSLIAPEYRGCGLHSIFHACRTTHIARVGGYQPEHWGEWDIFSKIAGDNSTSQASNIRSGMVPWDSADCPEFLKEAHRQAKAVLRFNKEFLRYQAQYLLFGDRIHTVQENHAALCKDKKGSYSVKIERRMTTKSVEFLLDLPLTCERDMRGELIEMSEEVAPDPAQGAA